jgi:high affinity Mn2+ porin
VWPRIASSWHCRDLITRRGARYRTEDILEAYYAWVIQKGLVTTFDYQFVANPAYNADRGPVSIFSARVHAEW